MDLHEFLGLLKGVKGSGNEYTAKCPAHDDRQASLCIAMGSKGIVLKCQAGCRTDDVVRAMGLKMADLFYRTGDLAAASKPTAKRPPTKAPAKSASAGSASLGTLAAIYQYQNAEGAVVFEVCRYEPKTFRQRIDKGYGRFEWKVPAEIRDSTIYHLPEVRAAIRDDVPIWIVEGEKDADNLRALGFIATCNPGGAGKWRDGHTEQLRGADCIVLADNDTDDNNHAGQKHSWDVASRLTGVAKRVRFPDLKIACPEIPDKGDVSDLIQITGSRAKALLERLAAHCKDFDPNGVPDWMTEAQRIELLYEKVPGYRVINGQICQVTVKDGMDVIRPLSNFAVVPRAIVTRDDGVNVSQSAVLDGWDASGRRLPQTIVPTEQFDGMAWVTRAWDFRANIAPGSMVKDKLRYAISEVGRISSERWTEYTHTGWRKIDGSWCYLHGGGAIGRDDVTVSLEAGLENYRLDPETAATYADGARESLKMLDVIRQHISIPLLGVTFLAPLREFMDATGVAPAFSLFILGGTGTRKSTACALALSHFGNFNAKSLPASFNDTANYIRKKAFLLKDSLFVVDDYHPVSSQQERRRMEDVAQSLSRAFGDGAERGRLSADLTMRKSQPPRSIAIISGEDTPNVGESGVSRYYIVNVGKDDVPRCSALTNLQEVARMGFLQKCMQGYIKWLLRQIDRLPDELHEMFIRYRERSMEIAKKQHGRSAEAIANIMIGLTYMMLYMRDIEVMDTDECQAMLENAWAVIAENSAKQARDMENERPTKIYFDILGELISSGGAWVMPISEAESKGASRPGMIGYRDLNTYYLLPKLAYAAVQKVCEQNGGIFPLTEKMLTKQLREDGYILFGTADSATRPKIIAGKAMRLLWFPASMIDGDRQEARQIELAEVQNNEFTQVRMDEIPEDFQE